MLPEEQVGRVEGPEHPQLHQQALLGDVGGHLHQVALPLAVGRLQVTQVQNLAALGLVALIISLLVGVAAVVEE